MNQPIYCGNGKVVQTKNGPMLSLSFSREDLQTMMNNVNQQGWVNTNVGKKRNPVQGKPTHYLTINTWQPNQGGGQGNQNQTNQGGSQNYSPNQGNQNQGNQGSGFAGDDGEPLPF